MPNPRVRFKREDGTDYPEWKEIKLENAVDFLDEKRKPITSKYRKKGQYPYYGASGIIDYIDDYIFDEELVLLSEDGANIVDRNYRVSFIATGKYWVNNHAHCLRVKKGFSHYFLSEALENIDYTIYNTGSAQPKLNQEVCRNLPLICPNFEEQQKIADFLSTVDEVIAQSEQEVQNFEKQKKAAMQKIFSQEVRFKREDGMNYPDWEEKRIGDFCSVSTGKSNTQDKIDAGQYPFYVRSSIIEHSDKFLFDEEAIITVGDGVGTGKVFHYVKGKYNLHQRCYRLYDFSNVNAKYFYYIFSKDFYKRIKSMSAKTSVDSVRMEMITDMIIQIPCLEEQQKIADFLSAYDEAITYAKQELDKWKQLKKGLLQQMFV